LKTVSLVHAITIDGVDKTPILIQREVEDADVDRTIWEYLAVVRDSLNSAVGPLFLAERLVQATAERFLDSVMQNRSVTGEIVAEVTHDFGTAVAVARLLRDYGRTASEEMEIKLRILCEKYDVALPGEQRES